MSTWDEDRFFTVIEELVLCHSPSGVEEEVNRYIQQWLDTIGVDHWRDEADNIIV